MPPSLVKGLPPVTYDCLSGPAYVKEEGLRKVLALREGVKYYSADFVRKWGGGVTPQIRNSFFAGKKIRKGGYPPNPILFFTKKQEFLGKNTIFRHF